MIVFSWLLSVSPIQSEQILDIFLSAFLPQGRANAEQLTNYFNKNFLPRLKKRQLVYTAFDNAKMVGFAIYEKWDKNTYYLAEMAVLPEYQGRGIGKQLVFSIFDKDQEASNILLVTGKENKWSQSFYEKIGFKHSSFQHPDYPENFIAYEFILNVTQ